MGHLEGDKYRPLIFCSVTATHPKIIRRRIEFMVDTGSDITAISKKDMRAMGLSYDVLGTPLQSAVGISAPARKWGVKDAILRFVGDDNTVKTFGPVDIYILETLEKTPSLLGRDFLIKYDFKLVYDIPNKEFFIEK